MYPRVMSVGASLFLCSGLVAPVSAETPTIVTDLPIIRVLVEKVAGPDIAVKSLLSNGASPHDWALRPSEARALSSADLIVWMGADLTPGLERAREAAARDTRDLNLLTVPGTILRTYGEDEDAHDHGDHDEDHDAHDKDHDAHGDDHDHGEDDHDDHASHGDEEHEGSSDLGHDHGHDHGDGAVDPHAWLDPENMPVWLNAIADQLAAIDPENAARYRAAAATETQVIAAATTMVTQDLAGGDVSFAEAHAAMGYFIERFELSPSPAVADGEARAPGVAEASALEDLLQQGGVACMLVEEGSTPKLALELARRGGMDVVEIDLLGHSLVAGDGYGDWLRALGSDVSGCRR